MKKKPSLVTPKQKRLAKAKEEIEQEKSTVVSAKTQTTVLLDAELLYAVKEIALNRKRKGIEPNTLTGIIKQGLEAFVQNGI